MIDVVLAVDAGGTKTNVALIASNKEIVYLKNVGIGSMAVSVKAYDNIKNGIIEALEYAKNKYNVVLVYAGLTAYAIFPNPAGLEEEISKKYHVPVKIVKDCDLALELILSTKYQNGVVAISGTGASCYGRNHDLSFMSSGWGQLLTEKGSGYCTVKDFIITIIENYEKQIPLTSLQLKFLNKLDIKVCDIRKLSIFMYTNSKDYIARYAPFFITEAANDNLEAKLWLKKIGLDLSNDCINCINHLNFKEEFVVGIIGGFIQHAPDAYNAFFDNLDKHVKNYVKFIEQDASPLMGALNYAIKNNYMKG